MKTKSDNTFNDMKSPMVINVTGFHVAEMYSEPELQVFPRKLKKLETVQCVITFKDIALK
jgi:hypothetical protein